MICKTFLVVLNLFVYILSAPSFFKHHYEVVPERCETVNISTTLIAGNIRLSIYNRTTKALTGKFKLLTDVYDDATVYLTTYRYLSNEYRGTAIRFPLKIKVLLREMNICGVDQLFKTSTPPMVWPLRKGITYHVHNWTVDSSKFPFIWSPTGRWMTDLAFFTDNAITKLASVMFYYEIKDVPDF